MRWGSLVLKCLHCEVENQNIAILSSFNPPPPSPTSTPYPTSSPPPPPPPSPCRAKARHPGNALFNRMVTSILSQWLFQCQDFNKKKLCNCLNTYPLDPICRNITVHKENRACTRDEFYPHRAGMHGDERSPTPRRRIHISAVSKRHAKEKTSLLALSQLALTGEIIQGVWHWRIDCRRSSRSKDGAVFRQSARLSVGGVR